MSIRTKFSLFTGLVVLVVTVIISFLAFLLQKDLIEKNMAEARMAKAAGFASVCRQSLTVNNELFMVNYVKLLVDSPDIAYVYFADTQDKILVHSDRRFFYSSLSNWLQQKPQDTIEIFLPVSVSQNVMGKAVVGFSEEYRKTSLHKALQQTLVKVSILFSAVALVGLLAAILFAYILTKPLKVLTHASEEIGKGNFQVSVDIKSSDELGDLSNCFNTMAKNLAQLDELKDEFISMVSHDLRSPLAAIKMYTDYMMNVDPDKDKLIPSHQKMLSIITDNAVRLGIFVSNVLDAAKMKAGHMEYHVKPIVLEPIALNMQTLFKIVAEQQKVTIAVKIASGFPKFIADPERFDQILGNLMSNALKFTKEGGTITIGASVENETALIYIADTGKGISKENLSKLFQKFSQVDVAQQKQSGIKGTGLGLFIVKQTVEAMGGTITVESEVNKGTKFSIRMPIEKIF